MDIQDTDRQMCAYAIDICRISILTVGCYLRSLWSNKLPKNGLFKNDETYLSIYKAPFANLIILWSNLFCGHVALYSIGLK